MRKQKNYFRVKAAAFALIASLCVPAVYTAQTNPVVAEAATPAPTGISIVAENGSATVTWDAVSGARAYALFMKDTAGNVALVHNRITGTSYSFSGLKDGARYGFVLKAYTSAGWSDYSATTWVTANVVIEAPANVTAIPGDGEVTVYWDPSYAAQAYAVFIKDTEGNVTLVHNRVSGTSYTIKGMKNGVKMGFVVKAYGYRQWSPWSKVAWTTPNTAFTPEDTGSRVTFSGEVKSIAEAKVGDTVKFGTYEQDNVLSNGAEDIEWLVLDEQDGKLFLLSKECLDAKLYDEDEVTSKLVTWENCTLRSWLNTEFYNTAFSNNDKKKIITTNVEKVAELENDIKDKVYILSGKEAMTYFNASYKADPSRRAKITEYAEAQGLHTRYGAAWEDIGYGEWWLRDVGRTYYFSAVVGENGYVDTIDGTSVSNDNVGVRPVLWISK